MKIIKRWCAWCTPRRLIGIEMRADGNEALSVQSLEHFTVDTGTRIRTQIFCSTSVTGPIHELNTDGICPACAEKQLAKIQKRKK